MGKRVVCSMVMILMLSGPAVAGLEVLVPPSQFSTVRPNIHIVGRAESPWVVLELNGKMLPSVETDDSMFHALVWLPYGLNTLTLSARADSNSSGDTGDSQTLEILCGPRIAREYQKVFGQYSFHDQVEPAACLECHDAEVGEGPFVEDADWCYSCHALIREQFRSHVTSNRKLCTNCHRLKPDLSWELTGVYTDMNPCFLCHKDKIGEFAQDFIHGPVAGGTCTVCHNPHGSQFEKNLRSPVPVLCLYCHTSIEERNEPVQHAPFAEGKCVACHDPHATGNRWVLNRKSGELCLGCHRDDMADGNHRHPTDAKPNRPLATGLALDENGHLECVTCHRPHYASAEFLLRTSGENACLGCHPEYQ